VKSKLTGTLTAVALAAFATTAAQADSFLGLGNDGDVYLIDIGAQTSVKFLDLTDFGPDNDPDYSPNALGYVTSSGLTPVADNAFRTTFGVNPADLWQGGSSIVNPLTVTEGSSVVAAGAVNRANNTYYYLDRDGFLRSVDIASSNENGGSVDLYTRSSLGDLAILSGDTQAVVSYDPDGSTAPALAIYNLDGTGAPTVLNSGNIMFAGLAFGASDTLYGLTGLGGVYQLSLTGGAPTELFSFNIDPLVTDFLYTDAARVVPIPAAAWLFGSALIGMAGIGSRRRSKKA
jgi:hypothetical protein